MLPYIYMVTGVIDLLGLILAALLALHQVALWQRKEYRLDRLWADAHITGIRFMSRGIQRPQFTRKAWFILATTAALLVLLATLLRAQLSPALAWACLIVATPIVSALAVTCANWLGHLLKRRVIKQAYEHRRRLTNLRVIGITGSYGKTSTKYFLHHLLKNNQDTIMSTQRRNEAFVIAQDMQKNLKPSTKTYIAEMGAYRTGEIAKIANLTQPTIGVVTAIGNQHTALFGSLTKLADAKWELIKSLPADGIAVLNADNKTIVAKARDHQGRIIWFSQERPANVYTTDSRFDATSTSATFHIGNQEQTITLPVIGEGYLSSALAAAAAAHATGVLATTIFTRLATVPTVPQTMAIHTNSRGTTIIDDSYSANEAGVLMAIRQLQRLPHQRKIVVMRPLIELGSETRRVHTTIGQHLAMAHVEVLLYDLPGAADIAQAALDTGMKQPLQRHRRPIALANAVRENSNGRVAMLLENRLPDIVRQTALE